MEYKKPKASGYSVGRGTRVKHSTAMDWDEWAEKRRIHPVKYSTGEDGQITHSAGREFDGRVKLRRKECEENKRGGARHPGFTYKNYRKIKPSPANGGISPKVGQTEEDKRVSRKPLKKVIIDY